MASYYARLDDNNVVTEVLAVADTSVFNEDGSDNETAGIAFFQVHYGVDTKWVHTRYDGSKRKNYAGKGFAYDATRDAFIPPQPFPSWILNEETCRWDAPIPYPNDGNMYSWDESSGAWIQVTE